MRTTGLSAHEASVGRAMDGLARGRILERILSGDFTVWGSEDREISNRLGWLDPLPKALRALPAAEEFARDVCRDGMRQAVLLGMGGSSLAPEVFGRVFKTRPGFLHLDVLDTTSPEAIARVARRLDVAKTLFVVSSKSGTTAETLSLFGYFHRLVRDAVGDSRAGRHFAAITDPGSPLEGLARRLGFRSVFPGDPEIGGRYSALSVFGLVPAALVGVDVRAALSRSEAMIRSCRSVDPAGNPAARLGVVLGVLARAGVDKATIFTSARIRPLGAWLEQLLAESTGKQGKGILPVPEDAPAVPGVYGPDRLFIQLRFGADAALDKGVEALMEQDLPVVAIGVSDALFLPGQFYLWEMATAIAGHILGINPFDQPNVESAKARTREALKAPGTESPAPPLRGPGPGSAGALKKFLARPGKNAYIALQAFLDPTPAAARALGGLRDSLRDSTRLPVTMGFGPRYLHSTGQLHKGDSGRGLFIQLIVRPGTDLAVPEVEGIRAAPTFGALFAAQARGDFEALEAAGRRVIRLDLGKNAAAGLRTLSAALR